MPCDGWYTTDLFYIKQVLLLLMFACNVGGPAPLTDNQLLHAGDEEQDTPLLAATVQSVLAEAADGSMPLLAMPLIGGGVAGRPAKLAAQVHIAQLHCRVNAATGVFSLKVTHIPLHTLLTSLTLTCLVVGHTYCNPHAVATQCQ